LAKKSPQHIDDAIAKRIKELHRKHGNLGHDGISRFLEDEGIVVDSHELRVFMDEGHLAAGPTAIPMGDTDPLRHIPHRGGAIKRG
jgi:hypothetical protein